MHEKERKRDRERTLAWQPGSQASQAMQAGSSPAQKERERHRDRERETERALNPRP